MGFGGIGEEQGFTTLCFNSNKILLSEKEGRIFKTNFVLTVIMG